MNGYLSDDAGNKSAVRLYGIIALLAGIVLAYLSTWIGSELGMVGALSMIGAAFTGKVTQKLIESDRAIPTPPRTSSDMKETQ